MRILLTSPYDLAVPGGVNRHALDLLAGLLERGHEVKLVGPASAPVDPRGGHVLTVGRVWTGAFNGAVSRVTLQPGIAGRVRQLVRGFAPEVVHTQEPFLPALNTFALLFARGARRVGTFHTYAEANRGYLYAWPWCNWVNSLLDVRIAVSAAARDFAAEYHPADYTIVPHGIRLPDGARAPAGEAGRGPVRVLMVGRIGEPRKGFGVLQAAWAQVDARAPGRFRLAVAGPDAPVRSELPIDWLGRLSEAELSAAYAAADIVVVPSIGGESFGLVGLEALAHGTPVIASRIRGYADWLGGTAAAQLVPPADPGALAAALLAWAEPAARAAAAAATRAVAARFARDRQVERMLRLYGAGAAEPDPCRTGNRVPGAARSAVHAD